ncbi:MAG: hypothetical protein JWO22_2614 [Frankiales bacterium]|nr:hypothetical protein [Frankiales bacterium]
MTAEELSGGREPRRWVPRVIAAVVVLLVAAYTGDRLVRRHERTVLRACVVAAESDLDDVSFRTAGLETYIASAVDRPDIDPAVRKSLRGIVQETILRGLPPLQRDQARCLAVHAWHGPVRSARRDYLAYLDLRLDQVQRAVADLDAWHVLPPEIPAARAVARVSLAAAGVPLSP